MKTNPERVLLGHGGGGKLTHQLIENLFRKKFSNPLLNQQHDGARLNWDAQNLVMTTDSYVVSPLFFPGGDIGTLAVNGTVNDLAMCGARPRYLSLGLILEEGVEMKTLERVVDSIQKTAAQSKVEIITGDTKVVEKGKADGLYLNTTGIGEPISPMLIAPAAIAPGDLIVLSGDIGRHGIAVMAQRDGIDFETTLESDCAPLWPPIEALLQQKIALHCLRDLTRGGLATALVELAQTSGWGFEIKEEAIPVEEEVRGACEILGLDPLYVANEGRFVALIPEALATQALATLHSFTTTAKASIIGQVSSKKTGQVAATNLFGANRLIDMLSGEQLPRIC